METWLRTRTSFVDKRLILHSRLKPWGSISGLEPLVHTWIDFEGLVEDTDPSQLPMELQEEYILDHQDQHFSMEQQQNKIIGLHSFQL